MNNPSMMAAIALAAGMEDKKKIVSPPDCSCNPDDPNYDPDCDCSKEMAPDAKVKSAVSAERSRITGILSACFPGQEKLAAKLIESGADLGTAACAFISDMKAQGGKVLASLDEDETLVRGLRSESANPAMHVQNPADALEGEAKWKAEFAGSKDLQSEFSTESRYLAFKKAEAAGTVKILRNKIDNR